jgi:hypothetical protein
MAHPSRAIGLLALALTLASLTRCASGGASEGSGGSGGSSINLGGEGGALDGEVSCTDDSRVDTYTANLVRPGARSVLSFDLVSSEPAPPARGRNTFELRVTDADGASVAGELGVELDMPDHGHGTSVVPVVTFDDAAGVYTITPLYLFMPGVWRIELELSVDGDALDRAEYFFCIEG